MLQKGDKAPDFKLESTDGNVVSLKDFKGKNIVLYFYPKDSTPGCTKEACSFRDNIESFSDKATIILGVSPDSIKSHHRFIDKQNLNFPLLSDPEHSVAEAYGAWGEKKMYGKTYMGIIRSTFIIDKKGKIVESFYNVKVKDHTEEVLANLA